MKLHLDTKELKGILAVVKAVAESSTSSRVTGSTTCLLKTYPKDKKVVLVFALNGAFLSYTMEEVNLEFSEEPKKELKHYIDLSVLSSLKLSGKVVTLEITRDYINFTNDRLKGKLLLNISKSDIEDLDTNQVSLDYTFNVQYFLDALICHIFGVHHNPVEANKRGVRIFSDKEVLHLVSQDKLTSCYVNRKIEPMQKEIDCFLLPKPLKIILSSLPKDKELTFNFGISREFWRMTCGKIDVLFPNIVKPVNLDLSKLIEEVENKPSYKLKINGKILKESLNDLQPFVSKASLVGKEDNPIVSLLVKDDRTASFKLDTSKAKDVEIELSEFVIEEDRYAFEPIQLYFNLKFLHEFIDNLLDLNGSEIIIRWWKYLDDDAPAKGKILSIEASKNRYLIGRIKNKK